MFTSITVSMFFYVFVIHLQQPVNKESGMAARTIKHLGKSKCHQYYTMTINNCKYNGRVAATTEGEHEDGTVKDIADNNEMQEQQHGNQDQLKER